MTLSSTAPLAVLAGERSSRFFVEGGPHRRSSLTTVFERAIRTANQASLEAAHVPRAACAISCARSGATLSQLDLEEYARDHREQRLGATSPVTGRFLRGVPTIAHPAELGPKSHLSEPSLPPAFRTFGVGRRPDWPEWPPGRLPDTAMVPGQHDRRTSRFIDEDEVTRTRGLCLSRFHGLRYDETGS